MGTNISRDSDVVELVNPPKFEYGQKVRSKKYVRNDGTFPGREVGDILVSKGDVGYVTSIGTFLQQFYIYGIDFYELGYRVGMRGKELEMVDAHALMAVVTSRPEPGALAGCAETAARIVGARVTVTGDPIGPHTLLISNHVSWIDIPVTGEDGWPEQDRGVVEHAPGLYFVGLPFLYSFASMLVGGVASFADLEPTRVRTIIDAWADRTTAR